MSRGNRFIDYNGTKLLDIPLDDVESRYGAPYYFIHRADLVRLLVDTAKRHSTITIRTNSRVSSYDFDAPSLTLVGGEIIRTDLIVIADGIKSRARNYINGHPASPQDVGDVAYRIIVPAQPLLEDPETAHLVQEPWATHWMGPEAHAVGYPLREGDLYNIIVDVTHSSDLSEPLPDNEQVWRSARSNSELVERFKSWCPQVKKLCAMAGEYLKWKLADLDELDRWVHPSGKVALLGDSCHPLIPYLAQGAAQSVEDAATLAAALRRYHVLHEALKAYEDLRKPRTAYIKRNTRILQDWLHLYDGPERDDRDRRMLIDDENNPVYWGWWRRKDWLFGHDATKLQHGEIPSLPPRPSEAASVYSRQRQAPGRL